MRLGLLQPRPVSAVGVPSSRGGSQLPWGACSACRPDSRQLCGLESADAGREGREGTGHQETPGANEDAFGSGRDRRHVGDARRDS